MSSWNYFISFSSYFLCWSRELWLFVSSIWCVSIIDSFYYSFYYSFFYYFYDFSYFSSYCSFFYYCCSLFDYLYSFSESFSSYFSDSFTNSSLPSYLFTILGFFVPTFFRTFFFANSTISCFYFSFLFYSSIYTLILLIAKKFLLLFLEGNFLAWASTCSLMVIGGGVSSDSYDRSFSCYFY